MAEWKAYLDEWNEPEWEIVAEKKDGSITASIARHISKEKNANLIAAAPDMYKIIWKLHNDETVTAKEIEQALAKAEGRIKTK